MHQIPFFFFCLFALSVEGQNKTTIHNFFKDTFGEHSDFTVDLPFKVKVKTTEIKRSNSPAFPSYELRPCKKAEGLELDITLADTAFQYVMKTLENAGGVVEDEDTENLSVVKFYSNEQGKGEYYALIIKQLECNFKKYCITIEVAGTLDKMEQYLTQIKKSIIRSNLSINK